MSGLNCLVTVIIVFLVRFVVSQDGRYRLENTTIPVSYEIMLNMDPACNIRDFDGEVRIKLQVLGDTDRITLHSKSLTIIDVQLDDDSISVTNRSPVPNAVTDILTIQLSDVLRAGVTRDLKIVYRGKFSTDKLGFYQSSYVNDEGETICLASTQFAPTQARRAFPCYDEPLYKADFEIVIKHPLNTIALSNEQYISMQNDDGKIVTKFKKVATLSSYLVGFVISDFTFKDEFRNSCDHRVYARKNEIDHVDFALDFGWRIYEHFEDYFNVSLPLKQMKHIGIPEFYFSAMENWGMITYKESRFLFNPNVHTVNLQHSIANVIAHEVTHHWFGDLVTMKWWTHVWLKEGFATLFSYYGEDAIHPHYNALQHLIVEKLQFVLTIDSDPTIKQMSKYIEKQNEIMANYDKIAYDKACCVLRMMEHAFSPAAFKKGIVDYLRKNRQSNTEEDDLFTALQEALPETDEHLDVRKIMTSWTQQSGYPVVTVTRNYRDNTVRLQQERFLHTGEKDKASLWWIPINFVASSGENKTSPDAWLNDTGTVFKCPNYAQLCSKSWLILNNQQTGYYRINYDEENWNLIAKALKTNHRQFHVHNRAQLIDDAFNLALVGRLKYSVVFNLIDYIPKDVDYAPWAAIKRGLTTLKQFLSADENVGRFYQYVQRIVLQPYRGIGLQDGNEEQFIEKFTRQVIVSLACEFGLPECLYDLREYNHPNLREIYYCNRLRQTGNYMFGNLRNMLKNTTDPNLRSEIISSFGCSSDRNQLSVILLSSLEKTSNYHFTDSERIQLIQNVYRRSYLGIVETVNFLNNEVDEFKNAFDTDDVEKLVMDLAKYINSVDLSARFNRILDNMYISTTKTNEAKGIIRRNLWWIADYGGAVFNSMRPKSNSGNYIYSSSLAIIGGILAITFV